MNEDMKDDWSKWIKAFVFPDDVHLYKMNGKLFFTLSGYGVVETNYVYISDIKDILVRGTRIDNLCTEAELHRAMANTVLGIQVDIRSPKSYTSFRFGGKQIIIEP